MRLGISTHSQEELAIALAAQPDYVALGPIYETRLKVMKWAPQGLDRIARLEAPHRRPAAGRHRRHHTGSAPTACVAAGADSLAVITDFFTHAESGGTGGRMAGVGRTLQSLSFLCQLNGVER